jgi:glycosyltransferase involved in cell wall biosynthesis
VRLLILTPEFAGDGGGIMTFYRTLLPTLQDRGVAVHVIEGSALHATATQTVRKIDGVLVETLERPRVDQWWERFTAYAAVPGLRRHLAAAWAMWEQAGYGSDADLVEASDWGLLFIPPSVECKRPLVVQCHGSIGQIADHDPIDGEETQSVFTRLLERATLGLSGTIQTYSNSNAAFWRAETGRDVSVIYPAWKPITACAAEPLRTRGVVIGRVQRWKGPEVLCRALERLGPRAPCIDWFGRDTSWSDPQSSTIAHLARIFPHVWGTKILHHPPITSDDVARRQGGALFNVVPSTWDVFNFTAVEAMASGRPTIVSTGAGASELIKHGVNGFLFVGGDADDLAAVIDQVLSESDERLAEIGRAGHEAVRHALSPQVVAGERIAAYVSAIDQFAGSHSRSVDGWLGHVCRPSGDLSSGELSFLEHHPLRALVRHVVDRISRRLTRR